MRSAFWFVLGCTTAAVQLLHPIRAGFGKGWEMLEVARTLAASGVYADPFQALPTGPTAMVPPGYPFLMSLLLRVTGDGLPFAWAGNLVSIAFHGVYTLLLWKLASRWLPYPRAAASVAALSCLVPAVPLMPQWDTIITAAGTLGYLLYVQPGLRPAQWVLAGLMAGMLALLNPISLPITVLRAVWMLRPAAIWIGVGLAASIGPWMVRNYVQFGSWNMRTNFGTTLYVSNNDCAEPGILASIRAGCYNRMHPNKSVEEAKLIVDLGEYQYDKKRTADSWQWMQAHPARTLQLAGARFVQYWFPPVEQQTPYAQAVWLTTILSIGGFPLLIRDRAPHWRYMAVVSVLLPLPYYFVVSDIRYRAPILWISQLAAGYLIARIMPGGQSASSSPDAPAPR